MACLGETRQGKSARRDDFKACAPNETRSVTSEHVGAWRDLVRLGTARQGLIMRVVMKLISNAERESEVARLASYFEQLPDGEELLWMRIESDTGMSMAVSGRGRALVRKALRRLKRPYEALVGEGIRLSAPDTAMTIVRGRFCRIDGAVRVADRTQKQLQQRHLEQMSSDDQRRMLLAAGFFGAIRAHAKEARTKLLR